MQTLVRRLAMILVVSLLPSLVVAQGAAAMRKIPAGVYQIVPDSAFSAGIDMTAFTMRFDGDSLMTVEQSGTMMSRAKITYEGDNILWTDLEGELMCPGTAKYKITFKASGASFRLTPVEDPCDQRSAIVVQIQLVKKG